VAKGGRFAELARAQFMVQPNTKAGMPGAEPGHTAVKV